MVSRLLAIAFIFACTAVAWMMLGGTIVSRTSSSDTRLRSRVGSTWGTTQEQRAPSASVERVETRLVREPAQGDAARSGARERTETIRTQIPLPLEQTRAAVAFDLSHRQKGLMWYSTYAVSFDGAFRFRNDSPLDVVTFEFRLPAAQAIYDDLRVTLNGRPVSHQTRDQALVVTSRVRPGDSATLAVAYKSQGLDTWRYVFGQEVAEVNDFDLAMRTNFRGVDFAENTQSPTEKTERADGWDLRWRYAHLISGFQIGMDMPQKLQPGELAGQIAFFAPVSLLFYFAVLFLIVTLRRIDLHPMNYAFLAAAFFSFHLLLAYLVDHLSLNLSFAISAVVSVALVVSYLRIVIGPQFAFREAAFAQLIYLVLFSYAFFFKGLTGLAITIGAIVTLFVAMQMTARVRWSEVFAGKTGAQ